MATFNSIEFKEFSTYKEVVIFMIQFLRGTQAALNSSQQIFAEGQPIYEKDTHQLKIGDGVNNYSGLPYIGNSGMEVVEGYNWYDVNYGYYYDLDDVHRVVFGSDKITSTQYLDEVVTGNEYTLWAGNRISIGVSYDFILPVVESAYVNLRVTRPADDTSGVRYWASAVTTDTSSSGGVLLQISPMAISWRDASPSSSAYQNLTIDCRRE